MVRSASHSYDPRTQKQKQQAIRALGQAAARAVDGVVAYDETVLDRLVLAEESSLLEALERKHVATGGGLVTYL